MMDLYQKLYAYLVGQMDEALTLLEAGEAEKARALLAAALLRAEERVIDAQ